MYWSQINIWLKNRESIMPSKLGPTRNWWLNLSNRSSLRTQTIQRFKKLWRYTWKSNQTNMMMLQALSMKMCLRKTKLPTKQNLTKRRKLRDLKISTDLSNQAAQLILMILKALFMADFHQDSGYIESIFAVSITNISKEILTRESLEMESQSFHSTHGNALLSIMVADKLIS